MKYGFVSSFANETIPICLLSAKTFSYDTTKLATMRVHLERTHSDKKNNDVEYFEILKQRLRSQLNLNTFFYHLLALILKEN